MFNLVSNIRMTLLFPWLIFRQPTGALLLLFFSLIGPASIFLLMLLAKSTVQYIFFWIIPIVYATYAKYHSTWACTAVPLVSIPATFGRLAVTLFQPCRFYKHISHEVVGQIYSTMYPLLNGTHFLCNLCKLMEHQGRQLIFKLDCRFRTAVWYLHRVLILIGRWSWPKVKVTRSKVKVILAFMWKIVWTITHERIDESWWNFLWG